MTAVAPAAATASRPSGKGKKASEAATQPFERQHGLHGAEAGGVHAAHLAGADAEGLAVAGVDDGVRFDVLADAPGEEQAAQFLGGGRTPGDDLELRSSVDAAGVGVLQQQSAGDVLDDGARRGGVDFDQAQILFGGEALAGLGGEGGRGDGLDEELGDFGGGVGVDRAIDADDAAEGGDGIAGEGLLVGLEDGCAGGRAAGVGVLDDDDGGFVKLLRQLPAGVEIDEVVEAEFLALELGCAGDAEAGAVGVERGALVGVFAVAERLGQRAC